MTTWPYDNSELQRYFEAEVVPQKEETKRIISVLKPDLDKLFQFIDERDPRLYLQVSHVGSYYQGLKVRRSDEFDYTLFIDISFSDWHVTRGSGGVYYGFKGCDSELEYKAHTLPQDRGDGVPTNLHITMNEKLEIEKKRRPLVNPGVGYFPMLSSHDELKAFHDMSFDGHLVPWLVKLKLKRILKEALELPSYFKGKFTSGFTAHGPALTLKYEHPDEKIQFPISIDISPAVNTRLPFNELDIQWPREASWTPWPSLKLQRAVKAKGVMMVAKQNFFWCASFAECEKELSKHADEDGGLRKQVHRLIKSFNDRFWSKQTKHLSSYMIKNAWLWVCESRPTTSDWEPDKLSVRVHDCIERLLSFLEAKRLPQYLNPKNNLLDNKDDIANDAQVVRNFLRNPPRLYNN